jgi:AAHS family 4-hydroxybenzoate transporter-like MFS transporter
MKNSMSWLQIGVVALCFLLNFNDGIDVLLVSFTGAEIMQEFGLSNAELGYIFSSGLGGMTAGCFVLAPLGDRIGRRKIFLISLALISLGMLSVYFATSYGLLLVFRALTGLGIGGILPNLATVASEFSTDKTRDFNVGIVQGGWPLGAILTGFASAWIVPELGWRFAYLSAGLFALTMLFGVYFVLPESPAYLNRDKMHVSRTSWRDLFVSEFRQSTIYLWLATFFGFITLYTVLSWVPILAKQTGMPFELATYIGTAMNLGAFSGVFVMGILIGRIGIKRVILIYVLLAFVLLNLYGNLDQGFVLKFALTFGIGFFVQGGFNSMYPASTRIYPSAIRSTGVGLAMGMGRFGAILGPSLFGLMADSGASISTRFVVFSLPIVLAAVFINRIKSENL